MRYETYLHAMLQYVGQKWHKTFLTLPILINFRHKNKSYNIHSYYIACHIFSILFKKHATIMSCCVLLFYIYNTFKIGISTTLNGAYPLHQNGYLSKLVFANSIISSPRPFSTAFIIHKVNPSACLISIFGGKDNS